MIDNKELLYEKIATISEQKGSLKAANEQLIKENEEFKSKIEELQQQVIALESGVSLESMIEFIDKLKEKLVNEINSQKKEEDNGESGTQE